MIEGEGGPGGDAGRSQEGRISELVSRLKSRTYGSVEVAPVVEAAAL
jgi:hypothetical protein